MNVAARGNVPARGLAEFANKLDRVSDEMTAPRPAGFLLAAAAALLMGLTASNAAAQTLTNPNAPKWSPPRPAAKRHEAAQPKKSCKQFGAGFVTVAGTDTCVKIGGWVTVEGGTRGR
jgi:hypothetical protein